MEIEKKKKRDNISSTPSLRKNIFELLPEDVILNILQRLPIKSLFTLKSVSRYFFNLNTNYSFYHHYTASENNLSPGLFFEFTIYRKNQCRAESLLSSSPNITYHNAYIDLSSPVSQFVFNSHIDDKEEEAKATKRYTGLSLSFLPHHRHRYPIAVITSNNGLLLCKNLIADYYVCNPLTMQWVALPLPPTKDKEEMLLGFVCDPPTSGSDGCTMDEYKVVRVLPPRQQHEYFSFIELETFCATVGRWKQSRVTLPRPLLYRATASFNAARVSCDGVLHWVWYEFQLLLCSTRVEQCWVVELPIARNNRSPRDLLLELSGGRIWFVALIGALNSIRLRIRMWILTRNGDDFTWSLERRIALKELVAVGDSTASFFGRPNEFYSAIALHPLDPNILFLNSYGCFATCDLRRKTAQLQQHPYHHFIPAKFVTPHLPWPTRIPCPSWDPPRRAPVHHSLRLCCADDEH